MPQYQISAKLYKTQRSNAAPFREVNFIVEAEDKEDAAFLFSHGVYLSHVPKGMRAVLDYRTIKKFSPTPSSQEEGKG